MLKKHFIAHTSPVADEKNVIRWKDYRITVLADRLFRIEKGCEHDFRDAATQTVWFRNAPPQTYRVSRKSDRAEIFTERCKLVLFAEREKSYVQIGRKKDGGVGGKKIKLSNAGNLKGTYRTLDGCDGNILKDACTKDRIVTIDLGNGVCSRSGVAVLDDTRSLELSENGSILPKTEERGYSDEYVFCYGADYRAAVKALYKITGKTPLVPRFALGNWWSRYHAYTDKEYLRLLGSFKERRIPFTVATIDMDWHYSSRADEELGITAKGRNSDFYGGNKGWTGYAWNKNLFPDYKTFLKKVKGYGVKTTLNLHPADGIRWWDDHYADMARAMGVNPATAQKIPFDIADDTFINEYFDKILHPYEKDGVDFWWIDWQQGTKSSVEGLDPLWSLNHYHYLDNAANRSSPLILSRYAGVGSHRYPIGFSGDTYISWNTLGYLPYFTATASNVGYGWWSHDIGGHHLGASNYELYLRHIEYGVFSPVNRLHGTSSEVMSKDPRYYLNGAGGTAVEWLRFRHALIPFLYTCSYRAAEKGENLIEPLYYEWDAPAAYAYKNEYLFGGLIVNPVTVPAQKDGFARVKTWLPEGIWTDIFTGARYEVPAGGKKFIAFRSSEFIPVFAKAGTILPLSGDEGNSADNPEKLVLWVFGGNGSFELYEDGTEHGNTDQAITRLKTELVSIKEKDPRFPDGTTVKKQILTVSAEKTAGAEAVIPTNRVIRAVFRDLPFGFVTVYKNGRETDFEEIDSHCLTAEFRFSAGNEYRVEMTFAEKTLAERLKDFARETLLSAEGRNSLKNRVYNELVKAATAEEFKQTVDKSDLPNISKLRLKETLL